MLSIVLLELFSIKINVPNVLSFVTFVLFKVNVCNVLKKLPIMELHVFINVVQLKQNIHQI